MPPRTAGTLDVPVLLDTSKLLGQARREVPRAVAGAPAKVPVAPETRGFKQRLTAGVMPGVRAIAGSMAALFAAQKVFSFVTGSIAEAREAQAIARVSEQRIKTTGGAAKITARQVGDLATAISNKTGKDDEAIQSGSNLLLTFTSIRNETGKNNDIFNQASAAATDMAAAMNNGAVNNGTMKTASIQLGKALNDPIRGITALRKTGVSFTQQQQDQIKTLVQSGDVLGAQKIILGEVRKEFGGTAAATSNAGERLRVVWGNIQEQLGGALLPILDRVAGFFADQLPVALSAAGRFFKGLGLSVQPVLAWLSRTAQTIGTFLGPALVSIGRAVMPAAVAFGQALLPALRSLWHVVATGLWPILKVLGIVIGVTLYAALRYVLPFFLRLAGPVLGLLISRIAVGIGWLTNIITWIGRVVGALLRWITGSQTTGQAVVTLGRTVGRIFGNIRNAVIGAVSFIISAVRGWLAVQIGVVQGILHVMGKLPGPMGAPFRKAEEAVKNAKATIFRQMDSIQGKINRLKGKNVQVTASTSLHFTKTFTQADWLAARAAAGRMRAGGRIRVGTTPTADDVLAWVSKGETVVSAQDSADPGFQAWAAAQGIPGFQAGGTIGGIGRAHTGVGKLMDRWGTLIEASLVKKMMAGAGSPAIKAWIRAQDPKPYAWGAAGPGSFDCSGIVSAVLGKMLHMAGAGSGLRLFTTSSIGAGQYGLQSGLGGTLQIGVTPGTGHMVGSYGGLGFEARSTATGIFTGAAARKPASMARHYHHAARGGSITALSPADRAQAAMLGALYGLDVGGDPGGLMVGTGGKPWQYVRLMDNGGWLRPGLNLVANRTGRPEPVPDPRSIGNTYNVAVTVGPGSHPAEVGARVVDAIQAYERRNGKTWRTRA